MTGWGAVQLIHSLFVSDCRRATFLSKGGALRMCKYGIGAGTFSGGVVDDGRVLRALRSDADSCLACR